jgi:hypothetical protein
VLSVHEVNGLFLSLERGAQGKERKRRCANFFFKAFLAGSGSGRGSILHSGVSVVSVAAA